MFALRENCCPLLYGTASGRHSVAALKKYKVSFRFGNGVEPRIEWWFVVDRGTRTAGWDVSTRPTWSLCGRFQFSTAVPDRSSSILLFWCCFSGLGSNDLLKTRMLNVNCMTALNSSFASRKSTKTTPKRSNILDCSRPQQQTQTQRVFENRTEYVLLARGLHLCEPRAARLTRALTSVCAFYFIFLETNIGPPHRGGTWLLPARTNQEKALPDNGRCDCRPFARFFVSFLLKKI